MIPESLLNPHSNYPSSLYGMVVYWFTGPLPPTIIIQPYKQQSKPLQFPNTLLQATLIRRYKRFLADVETPQGLLTLHCPNTGSMAACAEPGSRVWYLNSQNPKRKYPCTWELVEIANQHLACINTLRANQLIGEAIGSGFIKTLRGYESCHAEVKYGSEASRIDFLLTGNRGHCYVEVKSVTWWQEDGLGVFPDAITERGRKHLRELETMAAAGHRAVLIFCVPHTGITSVAPAWLKDPKYSQALLHAADNGVEIYAFRASITPKEMVINCQLPVILEH